MPNRLLPSLLLDALVGPRPFEFTPMAPPWLLLMAAIVAVVAIVYLYSAQQKIASKIVVRVLTGIRILLVLGVVAMLLGPVYQRVRTTHSSGTLWVLVDQSISMRQKDQQSTLEEQVRWADALGLLPPELRPSRLLVTLNQLIALHDNVKHLESEASHLSDVEEGRRRRQMLAEELTKWSGRLAHVADALDSDAVARTASQDSASDLRRVAESVSQSIVSHPSEPHAAGPWRWPKVFGSAITLALAGYLYTARRRLRSPLLARLAPALTIGLLLSALALAAWVANQWNDGAVAQNPDARSITPIVLGTADVPWQALHDSLSKAITQLTPLARQAEQRFLDEHGSDPRVIDAAAKVRILNRGALANAALTADSARGLKSLAQELGRQEVRIVPIGVPPDQVSPRMTRQLISAEKSQVGTVLKTLLKDPRGPNTDIGDALRFVAGQVGEDATVLVVSDGRQNVGAAPQDPARELASKGARVFTLLIGSRQIARDAAVDYVDAPDWVYKDDDIDISPVIRLDGLKDREVTVELQRGGEVIGTRKITPHTDQFKAPLHFTDRPDEGVQDYTVKILPVPDEAVLDNNNRSVRVAVKNEKIKVLIVEDQPRWEYQFLRNYLLRDKRVNLQVVLADPAHIEDVQAPASLKASPDNNPPDSNMQRIDAQILPSTKQEWSAFDIIALGDIPPEMLTPEEQKDLVAAIRDGGKTLLIVTGPRNMPMRFAGAPLAELMPVESSGVSWTPQDLQDHLRHGFYPREAPDGLNSIIGRFNDDPGINAELWSNLSPWFWHSDQTVARPGANMIWTIERKDATTQQPSHDDSSEELAASRQRALLATMNVGLGRVIYLASPQTWRLRYVQTLGIDARAEDLHRRFWGQVIRWATQSDLPAGNKDVRFGTDKRAYVGGEPIVVTARMMNPRAIRSEAFKAVAVKADGRAAGEAAMIAAPAEGPGIFRGTLNLLAGSYVLGLRGGQPEQLLKGENAAQKTLQVEVQSNASVEDQNVNTDPPLMEAIAREGDGIALDGPFFDILADQLPVIDRTETMVFQAGLFSSPDNRQTWWAHWIFFGCFVVLLTAEWVLRKLGGLV